LIGSGGEFNKASFHGTEIRDPFHADEAQKTSMSCPKECTCAHLCGNIPDPIKGSLKDVLATSTGGFMIGLVTRCGIPCKYIIMMSHPE